jgi:acetylornithine deacetylase/succinyl-diaminopimelate desuccinylase-like protein
MDRPLSYKEFRFFDEYCVFICPLLSFRIGVTEKGSANVELSIAMDAGHSSNPPPESTIDVLASAIINLRDNPHPKHFDSDAPEYHMLEGLAPYVSYVLHFFAL